MIKTEFIPLKQNEVQLYLIKLTIEELVKNTTVAVFNSETEEGYQRPPIPSHYKKISQYLIKDKNALLPLGVLTAINPEDIIQEDSGLRIDQNLRIVDGQHRVEGFRHLALTNSNQFNQIKEYEIPVTIMVIGKENEDEEINTFININSKGKKISTDLAIRVKHRRRRESPTRDYDELLEDIAISVAKELNNDIKSLWNKAIKLSPDQKGSIISLNAFRRSLIPLVDLFIRYYREPKDKEDWFFISDSTNIREEVDIEELLPILLEQENEYIKWIKVFIDAIWVAVRRTWPECFYIQRPFFDKEYNIQKGIGVFSIHLVLEDCILKEKDIDKAVYLFQYILEKSLVTSEDWELGGTFSGYNSQSGFRHIAEMVQGIRPLR